MANPNNMTGVFLSVAYNFSVFLIKCRQKMIKTLLLPLGVNSFPSSRKEIWPRKIIFNMKALGDYVFILLVGSLA